MAPTSSAPEQPFVAVLRQRRAELRDSMSALELALAAPAPRGETRWAERVHVALVELAADFREHIAITEGPNGLYRELRAKTPRLSGAIARLEKEHALIAERVDALLASAGAPTAGDDVDLLRDRGTALLGRLVRHRQRGADLVFEAYEVDIGGET